MSIYDGSVNNVKICGIASAVPKKYIDNIEFATQMGKKRNMRQIKLTGIEKRHICDKGQSASDFATYAAERLLNHLKWNRSDINILVFVTQQPDLSRPSTAMLIQKRLGLDTNCTCFDVNMGCSGFTVGLQIIASMLSVIGGKALLLVADGRYIDDNAMQSTSDLLFGDGGAAAALEMKECHSIIFNQKTDGYRIDTIMCRRSGFAQMDGNAVLMFSLNEVVDNIKEFCGLHNLNEKNIDFYVFHQGQKIILQGIANECNIPWEKVLNSYKDYGNTSSASIPISICNNLELLQRKNKVRLLMSGFGIGLSWGCVYVDIDTDNILPVYEFADYYKDKDELGL